MVSPGPRCSCPPHPLPVQGGKGEGDGKKIKKKKRGGGKKYITKTTKKKKTPTEQNNQSHTHTHFTTANTLARKNTIHLQELYINNKGKSQQLVCSSLAGLENTGTPQGNQSAERQAPLGSENKVNPRLNLSKQSFRDSHCHIAVMAQGRRIVSILEPRI